jgi:hypothetical protein
LLALVRFAVAEAGQTDDSRFKIAKIWRMSEESIAHLPLRAGTEDDEHFPQNPRDASLR